MKAAPLLGVSASMKGTDGGGRSASRALLAHALSRLDGAYPDVRLLDLRERPLPLFDGRTVEARGDAHIDAAHAAVAESGGLVISIPAYWSGVSGVFKNFVDCLCGPAYDVGGEPTVFAGKPVGALVVGADADSARAGAEQAVAILTAVGAVLVCPPMVTANPREAPPDEDVGSQGVAVAAAVARNALLAAVTA
jgi:NAD(P)H-dependent FMN reductase